MKKVLLASSSKAFLSRNETLLANKGFQFFISSSGAEALRLHQEHIFDLIMSDLELADMDGCHLCAAVHQREELRPAPVVIICHDMEAQVEKVKQSAASAILLRPINPTHLLITIGSFIDMQLARSKRVEFKARVVCRKSATEFLCNAHDISISGILLESEQVLEPESRFTCQFAIPASGQVRAEAAVARSCVAPDGSRLYGVKFTDLDFADRNTIKRYVVSNDHLEIKQSPHNFLHNSTAANSDFPQR
jgi:CheY-like chemotaxis protein